METSGHGRGTLFRVYICWDNHSHDRKRKHGRSFTVMRMHFGQQRMSLTSCLRTQRLSLTWFPTPRHTGWVWRDSQPQDTPVEFDVIPNPKTHRLSLTWFPTPRHTGWVWRDSQPQTQWVILDCSWWRIDMCEASLATLGQKKICWASCNRFKKIG